MKAHPYSWWGLGHMSHPDDPQDCCGRPADHPVHEGQPHARGCYCPACRASDGAA